MTSADLLALAERVEAASADEQFDVIETAGLAVFKRFEVASPGAVFWTYIKVGAFLDAAVSLVPEGWGWAVNFDRGLARANVRNQENGKTLGFPVGAATPALALTAAALRARAATEQGG